MFDPAVRALPIAGSSAASAPVGAPGGQPSWVQGDETPRCAPCGFEMDLLAQLEEGPDHAVAMNFGGGCAHVFRRACTLDSAKLLWQC